MNSLQNKQINYYKVFNQKPELSKTSKTAITLILPVAAVAVCGAMFIAGQFHEINTLTKQIASENAYTSDSKIQAQYNEYLKISSTIGATSAIAEDLQASSDAIYSYPEIRSAIFEYAFAYAGKTIEISSIQYDENSALMVLTGNSIDVNDASAYANSLEKIDTFYNVDYTGYTSDEKSRYYFVMQCTLNGRNSMNLEAE